MKVKVSYRVIFNDAEMKIIREALAGVKVGESGRMVLNQIDSAIVDEAESTIHNIAYALKE